MKRASLILMYPLLAGCPLPLGEDPCLQKEKYWNAVAECARKGGWWIEVAREGTPETYTSTDRCIGHDPFEHLPRDDPKWGESLLPYELVVVRSRGDNDVVKVREVLRNKAG